MKGSIWTVPNQITFLRLGFLPFFLILIAYDHYRSALLVLVIAVVILLVSGYRPFPPSIYGKLTTATEIILVFLVVLGAAYPNYHVGILNHALIYAVTVLSIVSGFHYSFTTARHLSGPTP